MIFTKYSPLTSVFKHTMRKLREKSVLAHIYKTWEGREVGKSENVASKTVLTPGQVRKSLSN